MNGMLCLVLLMVMGMAFGIIPGLSFNKGNKGTEAMNNNQNTPPPEFATVAGVVDAITIKLDTGHLVRYLGVRTPSITSPVECFGKEAVKANESIVGKKVRFEVDSVLTHAQDGAWVRYVYLQLDQQDKQRSSPTTTPKPTAKPVTSVIPSASPSTTPEPTPEQPKEIFINERILEGGFGFPVVSQEMKYGERLLSAARFANATNKGLWGQCKVENNNNNMHTQALDQCIIKGKVTSDFKKIYRTPDCVAYGQTTIIESQGGRYFCAEDIAKDAGFIKADDCTVQASPTMPAK